MKSKRFWLRIKVEVNLIFRAAVWEAGRLGGWEAGRLGGWEAEGLGG